MRISFFIILVLLISSYRIYGQAQSLLYNQTKDPQAIMLNPGIRYQETDMHIGIPFMSNLMINISNSAFSVADIFNDQDINQNIDREIRKLDENDHFQVNQRMDLINIGWHKDQYYYTAGFYQEFQVNANYPKDLLRLIYYGNASTDGTYTLDGLDGSLNAQGVFHFGINKAVNRKLYIGGRAKVYTASFNAHTRNNDGTFTSRATNQAAVLEQRISGLDVHLNTAGIDRNSDETISPGDFLLGSNLGVGIDLGFSYQVNRRTEITGSILDLGFISFAKDTKNLRLKGSYEFEGANLVFPDFDQGDPIIDYYERIRAEIDDEIQEETEESSYLYLQPMKLNLSWSYRFGGKEVCDCPIDNERLEGNQEIGVHFFAANYPGFMDSRLNFYYQRTLWEKINIRVMTGLAQFERSNFGLGISARFQGYSFFLNADTLRYADNFYNANDLAFQAGMSLML